MFTNDHSLPAADGTRIAYSVAGTGPALMLTNGITTSTTFWKYLRPIWLRRYTVITWDYPGHGNSGPACSPEGATIEALPAVMARILDATGLDSAIHVGWSVGSQVVLEMYRQYPERVRALGMLFGPAGRALESTALPVPGALIERLFGLRQAPSLAALIARVVRFPLGPGVVPLIRRARLIGKDTSVGDLREVLDQLARVDPHTAPPMLLSCQRHDAHDVLTRLTVPLLIMAGGRDPFMPAQRVALPMHHAAPGSELVLLEQATHSALLDFPEEIAHAVDDFIMRRVQSAASAHAER